MSSSFKDIVVNGRATQTQAATQPNHLVRLVEAQALLASLFQGGWNALTTYTAGMMATDGGSLYAANQTTLNQQPSANPGIWRVIVIGGANGASSYTYVGYASDASGTGFSLTPGADLNYIAFLSSATAIASPAAANFAGLWTKFIGTDGTTFTVTGPVTFSGGAIGLNAASANTASYVVQRDASGNFSAGAITATSLVIGSSTLSFSTSLVINTGVTVAALSIGSLTGILTGATGTVAAATITAPLVLGGGALSLAAASANTASYVVQRDGSGNFAAGAITAISLVIGSTTVSYSSGLNVNTGLTVTALTIGSLAGVLVATAGVVAGSATSNNVPEDGSVNVATVTGNAYFTRARVLATPLLGISSTIHFLATDTVLGAFGKLDTNFNPWVLATPLTGFTAGTGTVLATDTILAAMQKVAANAASAVSGVAACAALAGAAFTGPITLTQSVITSGSPSILTITGASNTTLTNAESSDVIFNCARTVQFATGTLALQRAVRVEAPSYGFVAASTLTTAASFHISGAPIAWSNATITTSAALKIHAGAVAAGNTNAYGLYVDAPTGATNNYAAVFNTGNVGIGTAGPTTQLDINGSYLRLRTAHTPSSSSETGNQGELFWDATYLYIRTASGTVKRVAWATF